MPDTTFRAVCTPLAALHLAMIARSGRDPVRQAERRNRTASAAGWAEVVSWIEGLR